VTNAGAASASLSGATNASVSSAIQNQSVGSTVTQTVTPTQFDVTLQLDSGQHLSFNVNDPAGSSGANTVSVTVTANSKTYLTSGAIPLTAAGQNFSPTVTPGAVQVEVQASNANAAALVAGINFTSTVQTGAASTDENLNPGQSATLNVNANAASDASSMLARPHALLRAGSGAPGSGPPGFDRLGGGLIHATKTPTHLTK